MFNRLDNDEEMLFAERGFVAADPHGSEAMLLCDANELFSNLFRREECPDPLWMNARSVAPAECAVHVTVHAVCGCDPAVEPIGAEPVIFPFVSFTDVQFSSNLIFDFL